jgi:peptidoglycan L-alanyl-D-glutamate endopeptidase CwlK
MASRDIKVLDPDMQIQTNFVVNQCKKNGVDILVYCTLRDLHEQAILFRSSDPRGEKVQKKIKWLRANQFNFLADIIEEIGPQKYSGWKTNAAPGESFHNYALAFDAVPTIGGKPMWNYDDYPEGWNEFGRACTMAGLEWGGNWTKYKDLPHAQLGNGSNPLRRYSSIQIKEMLIKNNLL